MLCDIGCGDGTNLIYCASGSYGIETDRQRADTAQGRGLNIYHRDILKEDISDLRKVDAVWCSAVLEHVSSPHLFLQRIGELMNPGALLAVYVPVVPLFEFLSTTPGIGKYVSGFREEGHISAFVPETLRFACEAAGYKTLEVSPFYPGPLSMMNKVPGINRLAGRCMYIGVKE